MNGHDILVHGPYGEGDRLSGGRKVFIPGWLAVCSCGWWIEGAMTERDADDAADRHLDVVVP